MACEHSYMDLMAKNGGTYVTELFDSDFDIILTFIPVIP